MLAFHLDGADPRELQLPAGRHAVRDGGRARLSASIPTRLRELFPTDLDFGKLGVEGYAGHPLNDSRRAAARPDRGHLAPSARPPDVRRVGAADLRRARQLRSSSGCRPRNRPARPQASYREIFEASEDAIFVHDWDTGAILDANPQACATYGYTREELLRVRARGHQLGRAALHGGRGACAGSSARRPTAASRFEWHRRSKDGSLHWDEVRLKAAQIGGCRRVLAFTREITERKQAEEALRASEEQYRAIFNASADALVLWNSRSERVDVNPAYERMYGYRRARGARGRPRRGTAGRAPPAAGADHRAHARRAELPRRDRDRAAQRRAVSDRGAHDPDPVPGRAARARGDPRPHGAASGRERARAARGAAAPGAEDGGDRPADRRHRARLQQPAHQHHGLRDAGQRARGVARRSAARRLPRAGAALLRAGARPDPADADVQPRPARLAAHVAARTAGRGCARIGAPRAACDRDARRTTSRGERRWCASTRCRSSRCCSTSASTPATRSTGRASSGWTCGRRAPTGSSARAAARSVRR